MQELSEGGGAGQYSSGTSSVLTQIVPYSSSLYTVFHSVIYNSVLLIQYLNFLRHGRLEFFKFGILPKNTFKKQLNYPKNCFKKLMYFTVLKQSCGNNSNTVYCIRFKVCQLPNFVVKYFFYCFTKNEIPVDLLCFLCDNDRIIP